MRGLIQIRTALVNMATLSRKHVPAKYVLEVADRVTPSFA